jgi:hypothetical protein
MPSNRLKLSPAGPMVLHAPSVWERRSLPALNKDQSEKSDWPFPFWGDGGLWGGRPARQLRKHI